MSDVRLTGGCQCGAVRYALTAEPAAPCLCFCRMCQKQVGGFFGAWAGVHRDDMAVTRGTIAWFDSSDDAARGFCRDCGTPLAYRFKGIPRIAMTIGSLDDPAHMKPALLYGVEGMVPWFDELFHLPREVLGGGEFADFDSPQRLGKIKTSNHQHPDHDTADWPPH